MIRASEGTVILLAVSAILVAAAREPRSFLFRRVILPQEGI
jgi:hypothetical protein